MSQSKTLSSAGMACGLRRSLLIGTALAAFSVPAYAQVAPPDGTIPDIDAITPEDGGQNPGFLVSPNLLAIDLDDTNVIITYNTFDLAEDSSVSFATPDLVTDFTAVNIVNAGGGLSDIFGSINAQSNIAVWLINAEGVAFGSTGSFSGASLLVSSLPWANQGFGNLTDPQFATAGATGAAPGLLIIDSGATLGTSGTPLGGSAIFISEGLTMDGAVNATGDVVLVGTRDVTWTDIVGSPLSFTINEGVRVNRTDVGVAVTGSLTGANIGVAAGGQRIGPNQLTAFILNIDSSATLTATANNGSIILATADEGGITVTNTVNALEEIRSAGDLVTSGTTANIAVTAADGIALAGGIADATGDVAISTTLGDIAATGGFTITGDDVTITSPSFIDFDSTTSIGTSGSAVGDVVVGAPGSVELGNVFANSLLSAGEVTLTEDDLTLGNVTTTLALNVITANTTLTFASLNSTGASVTVNTGTGNVAGGDIDAGNFVDVDGDDVTLGDVVAGGAIDIDATGAVLLTSADAGGALSVGANTLPASLTITGLARGDSVDLQASGAVNLAAVTATAGNIAIDSTTSTATVEGAVSATGNYDVTGTVVTLGEAATTVSQTADGSVTITATTGNVNGLGDLTLQSDANGDGTDNLTLSATTNIAFGSGTSLIAGDTAGTAADRAEVIVSTGAAGVLQLGDVTARNLHTLALTDLNQADNIILGDVLVDDSLTVVSSTGSVQAGDVTVRGAGNSLTMTSTLDNLDAGTLSATAAIAVDAAGSVTLAGAEAGTTLAVGSGILPTDLTISGLSSGTSVDLRASGLVDLAAVTATAGNVVIDSATGNVIAGDITASGNAFVDAGAGDNITLGDVAATSLSNFATTSLSAANIAFDTITTTNELYLIASNGDITGSTIRTDGTDIRLTATDDVLITGAFTALSGDPLVSGSIGIFVTDNVGSNTGGNTNGNPPVANLALEAGEDIAILSSDGSIYLTDVVAGDDIFLTATNSGAGNGSVSFDSAELLNLNVDQRQATFGVSPGTPLSVAFVLGESPSLPGRTLEVDARRAFLGDIINVPGDLIITATDEAVFSGNVNVIGNFIVTGPSVTLGQNNQTRVQTATGEVRITATDGDINFIGDLTLQSNADGIGNEGLFLTSRTTTLGNGDIGPGAGDTITLIGGTALNPSPIIVALDGNFTANSITADSLSITDGVLFSTTTPGSITIDTVDVNQSLILRSTGGSISVDTATVNNAGNTLIFAAGGVGQNVISGTSLTTNNADILLTAAGNVDVGLVDTGPNFGTVGISSGGNTLISNEVVAAEDILIEAGGNVGSAGSPVDLDAGDDIRVSTPTGTIFLNSAVTDGLGPLSSQVSFLNPRTADASLSFGFETFFGSDIVLSAANLLGPALTGSVEDALVVRDLSAGSAVLTADLDDIRLGNVDATNGNLDVTATAGSVSGLANGWNPLTGGSTISAPGDIVLDITGNAEIGSVTGATVTGTSFGRVTIGTLVANSATLTAVTRLQVDDGSVTNAALFTTTGGLASDPSLTATPPIAGFGNADLSASGLLSVSALSGAAQLGTISADGTNLLGPVINVAAEAMDIDSATTTAAGANIVLTASLGQLALGTANSAGLLTIDKLGTSGQFTATGALQSVGNLDIDSATAISADTLQSTQGNIILESTGDLGFATALADVGTFSATTTLGSGGDVTADRVRAQGTVQINSDGAITIDGDPASPAIPGFTHSIQSVGSTVTLLSAQDTNVFSVESAGNLLIDSAAAITAETLRSTLGNITLESTGDTEFSTALANAGTFTATTTTGSSGDVTADRVLAQGAVLIDSDGAITIDGDPASPAIAGFTHSIQSVGSTVTLASNLDTSVFSVQAAAAIDIDSDSDLRFDSLTGTVITLDAGDDITGLAGGGTGTDPLPGFGRGDVTGTSITIGALGTTGIVQLDLLDASGAVTVNAGQIDISTIDAATIGLTSTLDRVDLGEGDASGNITVIAATDALVTDANSTSGNIAVTANGGDATLITGAAAPAAGNITLVATGDANGTTLTGGGNLIADADANVNIVSAIMGGNADIDAVDDAVLDTVQMGGTIDVDAGANIRLGSLTGTTVTLDAGSDISGLSGGGAGTDPLPTFLRGDVNGTTITIGATGTTDIVQLDLLDASQSVTVTAGLVDISTADAGTFIDIDATTDSLVLGSGTAGTMIDLDKTGTAGTLVAGILSAGGDITADSTTSLELADVTSTGGALIANATGAAGDDDAIVTLADTSGAITITSTNGTAGGTTLEGSGITVNGVSVDVGTAIAGTGGISATANGGDLFMGTGTSGADITLIKTGNSNAAQGLTANTLTAEGDIDLLSDTFVNIGNASAGGFLTIVSPLTIDADLLDSDGGIALNTGGDAVLGEISSGGTILLLAAGDIDADVLTAAEDIAAQAGGSIAVGDFTAGDNVSLTAATTLDLAGGATTGAGTDNATYVFDLAQAGDTSVTSTAITDGPADAVDGDVLLAAPDAFNLTGAIDVAATDGSIIVRNLAGGSTSTSVGATGGFEITDAELGFLSADTVVIDSGDKPLELGTFTVPGQSLQLLSTGAITLSGAITGTGTGTLQIGQGTIGADGLVDPATLSESITAATETASITFASGIVDLRAVRIVFGVESFVTSTQGITTEAAGELVTNGGSLLYIGDNTQRVFLEADTLRVAYSDFALFQNTSLAQGGGVILNADAANSLDSLALELTAQGDDNLDSFAIFGTVNGFVGRTAGILPNTVLNIGSLSPRQLRVTQARSRVNGCVIGSPDRGCLITDLPPPEISTIDERQAQSLISTDDPSEFLNPLVGRGNEGLILDIAQIPVSIDTLECAEDDATCQPTETEE